MTDPAAPTTLVLLRHGVTDRTTAGLFCGRGGADPGLNDAGRQQAEVAAHWIRARHDVDVVVTSPLRRARQTAEAAAGALGLSCEVDDDLAEAAFGDWDGRSFAEVRERWPAELDAWLGSSDVAPPGGECLDDVAARVGRALDRLVGVYTGRTVLVVSHVTPIKLLACSTLGLGVDGVHRLELAPASVSEVRVWPDGIRTLSRWSQSP